MDGVFLGAGRCRRGWLGRDSTGSTRMSSTGADLGQVAARGQARVHFADTPSHRGSEGSGGLRGESPEALRWLVSHSVGQIVGIR